ncbi:uncharacterized protein [Nothobranchius furzeri]|uniref:uncharacterized protein isoform X2 n=1 Tax=Nothobranchius furzeri TaxID=105023 RepID=UPI002403BE31|nr:uncharacterized protein LOC129162952 isoform X2 [Nothobranchius furzeri]
MKTTEKQVDCKLCKVKVSFHGSTSAMHEHLKRKHVMAENEESPLAKRKRSSTMDKFLTRPTKCTPQQANALTEAILNMLVTDMRPLSMVGDEGFKDMIKMFNQEYYENYLPGRSHFTTLMERKYETTFEKALRAVTGSPTLTADVWTSRATEAYLGVSCHFLSEDWNMKSFNLAIMPLEERHTGTNIMTWIEEVLAKFEVLPVKIKAVVHDSAMVAAMRLLEEKHGWASFFFVF